MPRTPVTAEQFVEPFNGIGVVIGVDRGLLSTQDNEPGSAALLGTKTALTAWHVVDDLDEALVVTGAPSITWINPPVISNPNETFQQVVGTQDLALIKNLQGNVIAVSAGGTPLAFGMDVFLDHDEWIQTFGGIPTTHAGFPAADGLANFPLVTVTSQLFQSTGEIDKIVNIGQSRIGSDVNFKFETDFNNDGFIDAELVAPFVDGALDGAEGQSGGPLLTFDPQSEEWRILGVGIQATSGPDESAFFELITPDSFKRITTAMVQIGDAPPPGVTQRITGTLGEDRIEGSPFDDLIRGLGSTGVGDALFGGAGNDIYEFSIAYGDAAIFESANAGEFDALSFPDLQRADVQLSRDGTRNLYVNYLDPTNNALREITIRDHFAGRPVEEIRLADGVIPLTAGLELVGTELADNFGGTPFDDTLIGLGGNDVLSGFAGNDTLVGGEGADNLFGGEGSDIYVLETGLGGTITETEGDRDQVFLDGLNFDDVRLIRPDVTGLAGGSLSIYEKSTGNLAEENQAVIRGQFTDEGQIEVLVFANGEELDLTGGLPFTGSDGRDNMRGTAFADDFFAGGGQDFVDAGDGDDFIVGETGNDVLSGGEGDDTYAFQPGDGEDTIIEDLYQSTDDAILLQGFNPAQLQIDDFFFFYTIALGADTIRVNTRSGVNPIESLIFAGGGGVDFSQPGALSNTLPDAVDDVLEDIDSGTSVSIDVEDLLANDTDADPEATLEIVDVVDPQGGTVSFDGSTVIFTSLALFLGLAGFRYLLSDGTATVPVDVSFSVVSPFATEGDDLLSGTDGNDVIRGLGGDDTLRGYGGNDLLDGGTGNDTLFGDAGNDALEGRGGSDIIYGGDGFDTASYATSDAGVEIDLGAGTASGGDAAGDRLEAIENLIGSAFADRLAGDGGANTIEGGDGDDLILMYDGGDDVADGGDGNDGIVFGSEFDANDRVDGGAGTLDQLGLQGDYSGGVTFGAESTVGIEMVVLLPGNLTTFGAPGGESYSYDIALVDQNVEPGGLLVFQANQLGAGEDFTLDASAETDGAVFTYAGLGTEDLTGTQTDDAFFFGTGRFNPGDRVDGQGGSLDSIGLQGDYSGGLTFGPDAMTAIEVLALLSNGDTRFGGGATPFSYDLTMDDGNVAPGQALIVSANTLGPDETLTFDGSAETDGRFRIFSGNGADSIAGSQGADDISGRLGADVLTGNGGNDAFLYTNLEDSTAAATDRITDFTVGDRINLAAIDAVAGTGANDAFTFIGAAAFTEAGQLRAENTAPGTWRLEADVTGNALADLVIDVETTGPAALTAADFVL